MDRAFILLLGTVVLFLTPGVNAQLTQATNMQVNITRTGCGVTKLCVATPDSCDPAGNSTCLFASANASAPVPPHGVDMSFQLSGNSSGYIALGLTKNSSEGTTMLFICANSNQTLLFGTQSRNNTDGSFSSLARNMTGTHGTVNGDLIKCEFSVLGLNASSTRAVEDTAYVVLLGSGTINGTSIGPFAASLTTNLLNIANPTGNFTTTTVSSGNKCALHSHVTVFLVSILTMSVLKTA